MSKLLPYALAFAVCACVRTDDRVDLGSQESESEINNGLRLNGLRLNGLRLNGLRLNGLRLNGLRLNGLRLNGLRLNGLRLNGLRLNGLRLNGVAIDAVRLDGVQLGELALAGSMLYLRVLGCDDAATARAERCTTLDTTVDAAGEKVPAGTAVDVPPGQWVSFYELRTLGELELDVEVDAIPEEDDDGLGNHLEPLPATRFVSLRFDAIEQHDDPALADVFLHTISVAERDANGNLIAVSRTDAAGNASTYTWQPLCNEPWETTAPAIPVAGYWDEDDLDGDGDYANKIDEPGAVTFGCANGAVGKCVVSYYQPWEQYWEDETGEVLTYSWSAHHQACTRMLRADYCGDGRPWTVDGTLINAFDDIIFQDDDASWPVEAEWAPWGANCLSVPRIDSLEIYGELPACMDALVDPACGSRHVPSEDNPTGSFTNPTTLLVTEVPVDGPVLTERAAFANE